MGDTCLGRARLGWWQIIPEIRQWHSDKTAKTRFRRFRHYLHGHFLPFLMVMIWGVSRQGFDGFAVIPGAVGLGWAIITDSEDGDLCCGCDGEKEGNADNYFGHGLVSRCK